VQRQDGFPFLSNVDAERSAIIAKIPSKIVQRSCKLLHKMAQSSLNVIKPSRTFDFPSTPLLI
jgi:hypothetical protein